MARTDIRLALPSKGRLEPEAVAFLEACGLKIYKPNPRQYQAVIPAIPGLTVLLQRPGDLVVGVREGSIDFGIAGLDSVEEHRGDGDRGTVVVLHDALGFGHCALMLAVPEAWAEVDSVEMLRRRFEPPAERPLRVATKFPLLTRRFLEARGFAEFKLITAEGTLEVAPAIGYADAITDLVSSGTTLRDNRLRPLDDGVILQSQAALIANRQALAQRPEVLAVARELLEYMEAHLRAENAYLVFANMRGETPEAIARRMFAQADLEGLQGPTISRVVVRDGQDTNWHAVNIVVAKDRLSRAIAALRRAGGSGVVVSPVTYIFEEESDRYHALLQELGPGAGRVLP
jgi:ATP phosphoribosyltransferase